MLSFHTKFVQTDRRMNRLTDRQTTVKQYAPDLSIRRHKNIVTCSNIEIHFTASTFDSQSSLPNISLK